MRCLCNIHDYKLIAKLPPLKAPWFCYSTWRYKTSTFTLNGYGLTLQLSNSYHSPFKTLFSVKALSGWIPLLWDSPPNTPRDFLRDKALIQTSILKGEPYIRESFEKYHSFYIRKKSWKIAWSSLFSHYISCTLYLGILDHLWGSVHGQTDM